jgi:hypothetical protein
MGMAANPSGAHQAGRVFAGRIDEVCVSVRQRRTLTPARFTEIENVSRRLFALLWDLVGLPTCIRSARPFVRC